MSRGKYSPYACLTEKNWTGVEFKVGTEGTVEVDKFGFDWYGYDENGKDHAGNTEWEYLADEDLFLHHVDLASELLYKQRKQ